MSSPVKVTEISLEEEYSKPNGITREDIRKLRDWLDTQPHLPSELTTELDLILTYHSCENSPEVAKQVLDTHFTLKTLFTGFFKDRVVDATMIKTLQVVLLMPLEMRTKEGYAVIYGRIIDTDVKKFVLVDLVRVVLMMLDLWHLEDGTWPGLLVCIDLEQVALGHLARLDLQTLQQFLYYVQEALLVRLKGIHFLNAPSFMDKLMMMVKPFLKKKFLELIVIHQVGAATLDRYVPREALPKEKGGNFKSFAEGRDDMIRRLELNADFFPLENKKRVMESRRPGRPKTISDVFNGIEGSFKKLDID